MSLGLMSLHIVCINAGFAYGREEVLSGVSFEVMPGEVVGILGPNGAGKSTLIHLLGGFLRPREGEVLLDERPVHAIPAKKRAGIMALVPQETLMPFSFTAMEVVLMGRAARLSAFGFESAADIQIAKQAMEKTDCLKFASRDINELSGGERKRIILARALAQEPKILFLDEPTTFLDIRHQIELHRLLRDENKKNGLTIVSAMHDLNLAATFCDRVIVLKNGRVMADGRPEEVVNEKVIYETFETRVRIVFDDLSGKPYWLAER